MIAFSARSSPAMKAIEPMPEALRSSVRSGFRLFDFAQVVEELVFNSLDAGASTVSVSVGVRTCFVKVVDDGLGITRDGLELLGQRYATSKFNNFGDRDAETRTFGFRGESLASICDFSLLDIVTRVGGRANGYRKVMKGSKCLCLGISDDMKDAGTTVVVRDLFYNQPVRRNYMQSSPKKVLQSVKKCVLRIALVYSKVSFRVVDVESEDILLSTHASTPMSLLATCFGTDSSCFHELNIRDGKLKLFGFISGPCDTMITKAFQYVYINSRFVSKGPIHKLVNRLSSNFEYYDQLKAFNCAHTRKRSRHQTSPAFILNIACHQSLYDLTFEPSKTYVEFKDWTPVLALLEEVIQRLWTESIPNDDIKEKRQMASGDEMGFPTDDLGHENFQAGFVIDERKWKIQNHQASLDPICFDSDILSDEENCWSRSKQDTIPSHRPPEYPDYFNEQKNKLNFIHQINQNEDRSFFKSSPEVIRKCKTGTSGVNNQYSDDNPFSMRWESDSFEGNYQHSSEKEPLLKSCSMQGIFAQEDSLFTHGARDHQDASFNIKEMLTGSYDRLDVPTIDNHNLSFHDFSRSFTPSPIVAKKSSSAAVCETPRGAFPTSIPNYEHFDGNERLSSDLTTEKFDSEWCSVSSDPFSHSIFSEIVPNSNRTANSKLFMESEENFFRYDCDVLGTKSIQENGTSSSLKGGLGKDSDIIIDEAEWLNFSSHFKSQSIKTPKESEGRPQIVKRRSRSHSAPPIYKSKRRFLSLNCHSTTEPVKNPVCSVEREHVESISVQNSLSDTRNNLKNAQDYKEAEKHTGKGERSKQLKSMIHDAAPIDECPSTEVQDSPSSRSKWRNRCSQALKMNKVHEVHDENSILDISCGLLHLAGDSIVPETLSKSCLENAIVLHQVDKKFIPIVAGRILALVDQHAADERIRLEELRKKVLSGKEGRTITYLKAEQELAMPELQYQLLHNYAEEIKEWGWICNVHAEDLRSFKRNLNLLHWQPTSLSLTAVPCILGVNLTGVDLMEYLQQLSDTDGSSTIPPSVLRILNSKACRGAIMFGDSLLPSECSLLISELKQTSLCFQCAHGRPTTVPLVNLAALTNRIAKMTRLNNDSTQLWHGLRQREITLERAEQRLNLTVS